MLVLASSSPRRAELLRSAGIPFATQPSDVDETARPGERPLDYALRMAREKAHAVAALRPNDTVLGADTIVVVDNDILGKPRDADDARAMLRRLSGRWHEVTSAVCLVVDGRERLEHATTRVEFSALSDDDIAGYVALGEPMDKAGAYGIQGIAARWIPRIEGDYSNVVGLPVALVWRMLRESSG
jgi:septum formation protein